MLKNSDSSSCSVTLEAIDGAKNITRKTVLIYASKVTAESYVWGSTRFISEKYYSLSHDKGGLDAESIWLTNGDYATSLTDTFNRVNYSDLILRI